LLIALCLPNDAGMASAVNSAAKSASARRAGSPSVVVAMAVAALGYGIMNLLMIQASMHMKHMHEDFTDVRLAIQWHVIAMFAPSFFTGAIIQRLGIRTTICAGLALLIGCSALNIWSHSYAMMTLALIALGLGWNLTYAAVPCWPSRCKQPGSDADAGQERPGDCHFRHPRRIQPFAVAELGWLGRHQCHLHGPVHRAAGRHCRPAAEQGLPAHFNGR
jgi:predicted MFS family arabinose efflux permease